MLSRWCSSALLRKKQIEEGLDLTFSKVFVPYYIDVLKKYSPSAVLEIGCGTGHMALELSKFCNDFTVTEPSQGMFNVAKEVLQDRNVVVFPSYLEDLTADKQYDLIYSHMCLQVIEDCKNFFRNVKRVLAKDGVAVFSIPHPCFYNDYKSFFDKDEYGYMKIQGKVVSFSITKDRANPIEDIPYNHRPISYYLNLLIDFDFSLLKFDEIFPADDVQLMYGEKWVSPRYCSFVVKLGQAID